MKNKLKYLLAIGVTLGITNGATALTSENNNDTAGLTVRVETHRRILAEIEPNNHSPLIRICAELDRCIEGVDIRTNNLKKLCGDIVRGTGLSQQSKKLETILIALTLAKAEKNNYIDKKEGLKKGTLNAEDRLDLEKRFGGRNAWGRPSNRFAVEDTTSSLNATPPRTQESLLKEAQQSCLGTVIGIHYDAKAGALQTVLMAPSTIRPQKPAAPRSPIFEGSVSWEDIMAEVERDFMLPPSAAKPHTTHRGDQ
jgi:hypothetical protein